jgi:hypothetical protein
MPFSSSVKEFDNKIINDIKEAIKSGKAPIREKRLKNMNIELNKMVFSE